MYPLSATSSPMISVLFAEALRLEPADDVGVQSVLSHSYREQGASGRILRIDHSQDEGLTYPLAMD